jgi:hypothetical protein
LRSGARATAMISRWQKIRSEAVGSRSFPLSHSRHGWFVKELVDEQGAGSITLGRNEQFRQSKFESLLVTQGVIFVTKVAPRLEAFPNPVPAGKGPGKTTPCWNSFDGKIYVSINGREEMLFASSPRGSQDADWIEAGSRYEFRLYNSNRDQLFDKSGCHKGHADTGWLIFELLVLRSDGGAQCAN